MAVNNFNLIAPFYDGIARLVFGNDLLESQIFFLRKIKSTDSILVLGGGTGSLLEFMPVCEKVDFVEKSKQMIKRAARKKCSQSVNFIHADFLTMDINDSYDVIISPFFLDCYSGKNLNLALGKIKDSLAPEGALIVSDFQETKSNKFQLSIMHIFFRILTNLDAKSLSNIHEIVLLHGFVAKEDFFLHQNRLFSRLYRNL